MSLAAYDAPTIVVLSLACRYLDNDSAVEMLQDNGLQREISLELVDDLWQSVPQVLPKWAAFLDEIAGYEGVALAMNYLAEGKLAGALPLPARNVDLEGLQKTLGGIIKLARLQAVKRDSAQKREASRSDDDPYFWWDHPGEFGV